VSVGCELRFVWLLSTGS